MSLTTEDEAKKRWCPFARHEGIEGGSYNRDYLGGASTLCIASQCMAWQWGIEQHDSKPTIEELEKILQGPEPHVEVLPSGEVVSTTKGYGGLAGKP